MEITDFFSNINSIMNILYVSTTARKNKGTSLEVFGYICVWL